MQNISVKWISGESHTKTSDPGVYVYTFTGEEQLPQLDWIKPPKQVLVVIAKQINPEIYLKMINQWPPFELLQNDQELQDVVKNSIHKVSLGLVEAQQLYQLQMRSKDLERMTQDLERMIVERTEILSESTNEEKRKLSRERELIRFLNEISHQHSVQDILRYLRREFKSYHKILSLIFTIQTENELSHFYHVQQEKVVQHEARAISFYDENSLRQACANVFARPLNKMLIQEIQLSERRKCYFALEYSMLNENEVVEIRELLFERSHLVKSLLEKISDKELQRQYVQQWEKTFDHLKGPLAVIDQEMNLLRGNRLFGLSSEVTQRLRSPKRKCYEVFAGRESTCENCELAEQFKSTQMQSCQVKVHDKEYKQQSWPLLDSKNQTVIARVVLYEDQEEAREFFVQNMQNEKLSALGELAGHIAHELNNPLTGLKSLTQILQKETDEAPLIADLQQIENATKRCLNLIKHFIDYSRGSGAQKEMIRFDEIVEGTLPFLKTAMRPHRQEILLAAGKTQIYAHPQLLQQVIFNLVNNACQALTTSGVVGISTRVYTRSQVEPLLKRSELNELSTSPASDEQKYIELIVADNGPGIDEKIKNKIFEPFTTTKAEGVGTGLGLSTCLRIVKDHGGVMTFESKPDQGTQFKVYLPTGVSV